MRFLHTADWHLGLKLHGKALLNDQAFVLEQIIEQAESEHPNFIVIAGDVYEQAVPPAEAIELLNYFLEKVILKLRIPVVMIAGNHDCPRRLEFGSSIFRNQSLHIFGTFDINKILQPVEFPNLHLYSLPFVRPLIAQEKLKNPNVKSASSFTKAVIDLMNLGQKKSARRILLAHQSVVGAVFSGSEKNIWMREDEYIEPEIFAPFDYVALGHFHRAQNINSDDSNTLVRYAGSPMKYSFQEVTDRKSVTIVEIPSDLHSKVKWEEFDLKMSRDLRVLKGKFSELLEMAPHYEYKDTYLSILLEDENVILDAMNRFREFFPNLLHLGRNSKTKLRSDITAGETSIDLLNPRVHQNPLKSFETFYQHVAGAELGAEETSIMKGVLR